MTSAQPSIYILWGQYFEELITAIFVRELRRAGLRVKVVGIDGRQSVGAAGLLMTADITLSQALHEEANVVGVVLPCALPQLLHLQYEPRLTTLFAKASANHACFFVSPLQDANQAQSQAFAQLVQPDNTTDAVNAAKRIQEYPLPEKLVEYVRNLAQRLLAQERSTRRKRRNVGASPIAPQSEAIPR